MEQDWDDWKGHARTQWMVHKYEEEEKAAFNTWQGKSFDSTDPAVKGAFLIWKSIQVCLSRLRCKDE